MTAAPKGRFSHRCHLQNIGSYSGTWNQVEPLDMSQEIPNAVWLEQANGQSFAVLRIRLDAVNMPDLGSTRREMDEKAREILTSAFPEDWQKEADRLDGLVKQTRESIDSAEKQIRALQNQRNNLFAASNAAGADFDKIDDLEANAEARKAMATKRLAQFKTLVEAHEQKLFTALLGSPANNKLIRGEYLEPDPAIQATLDKVSQVVEKVADNIARATTLNTVYQERRGSYTSLASAVSSEWSAKVLA